jgi:hypothetical protein
MLLGLPPRDLRLAANLLKPKLGTQLGENGLLIVTHGIKAAALRWPVQREKWK